MSLANQVAKNSHILQRGGIKLVPLMLIALVAASAGVWFGQWQSANSEDPIEKLQNSLKSSLVFPSDYKVMPAFSLLDAKGETITESALENKWSLVFFGFTHCPDVCPITLSVIKEALQKLNEQNPELDPFQVLFVSVDPNRDTPELLDKYLGFFDNDFIGVTGDLNGILKFTKDLSIVVSYNENEDNAEDYSVDHTVSMLLVDPELRIRGKFNPPHEPDTIAADYQAIRAGLN